jgi:hypothetical protein
VLGTAALFGGAALAQEPAAGEPDAAPAVPGDDETGKPVDFTMRTQSLLYGTFNEPQRSTPFNPGNRFAAIPSQEINADLRVDLTASAGACTASAKLRAGYDYVLDADTHGDDSRSDVFLNAGGVRCELGHGVFVSAGREVLQWGSASYLSPSNPLFAETGKTNPLSDLYGKDIAQVTWYANERLTVSLLHNYDVGSRDPEAAAFSPLTALKLDWIGDRASGGAILSKRRDGVARLGFHGTYTYSDALLVYADVSVGRGHSGWYPLRDAGTGQWRFEQTRLDDDFLHTSLLGGSYTFESGWSLTAEWLTGNEGYDRDERRDYLAAVTQGASDFTTATNAGRGAQLIGASLTNGLRYLGSDHVFLQLLRSEWNDKADVALRWTRSFGSGSGHALSASATYYVTPSLQVFAIGTSAGGGGGSDFGRLVEDSALLGLRWYF